MCRRCCVKFCKDNILDAEIKDKDVIEIGSYNVNGSLKDYLMSFSPKKYIGVDFREGPYVDIVCNAENIVERFGRECFDFVLSTETMEHIEKWQLVISNIKNICRTGGIILITTVCKGYPKHEYPFDYWRYEIDDLKEIFSDCIIERTELLKRRHGVSIKVRKPNGFVERDLSNYNLYKIT